MKFILVLHMCSLVSGQCPSNSISGLQFDNHYDCVANGYRVAHNTFLNLKELEEFERDYIEREKIVVKFECKKVGATT
tara:strand:+ start:427 stop:660 length:234 start_codon:yes stop_codon:yes gene_type:complete